MKKIRKNIKSKIASICGFLVSFLLVIKIIDWNKFDWSNPNDVIELLLLLAPWVGGIFSEVKDIKLIKDDKP